MNASKAIFVVTFLAVLSVACEALARSGVQFTRDRRSTLISKDVGDERWAIAYNLESRTATGNVFYRSGRDPSFVWCEETGNDGSTVMLSCYGAEKCPTGPCTENDWSFISNVSIGYDFLFPPGTPIPPIRPFDVYADTGFIPSGFMGDFSAITLEVGNTVNPHSGSTCAHFRYSGAATEGEGWAGVYFQYPANNFGAQAGRTDLQGHSRLSFWVRGDVGGETLRFGSGGINRNPPPTAQLPFQDSYGPVCVGDCQGGDPIVLSSTWTRYTINLEQQNLTTVIGPFFWTATAEENPQGAGFCLDDIFLE
jgi:hypothetical protein